MHGGFLDDMCGLRVCGAHDGCGSNEGQPWMHGGFLDGRCGPRACAVHREYGSNEGQPLRNDASDEEVFSHPVMHFFGLVPVASPCSHPRRSPSGLRVPVLSAPFSPKSRVSCTHDKQTKVLSLL